jgi:enoyl-CoA hydratase
MMKSNSHDFEEGVRALLIDKDLKPNWMPKKLQDVRPEAIERLFAPLEQKVLNFDHIAAKL